MRNLREIKSMDLLVNRSKEGREYPGWQTAFGLRIWVDRDAIHQDWEHVEKRCVEGSWFEVHVEWLREMISRHLHRMLK